MQKRILTNRQDKPKLYIFFLVISLVALPSLIPWKYEPYYDFYPDMTVGMFASLLAVYLLIYTDRLKFSITAIGLLIFALYLPLQSLIIQFPYIGNSFYISGFFVLMVLLLTALLSVPQDILKYITFSLLWAIVILATIQLCSYLLQLAITDGLLREKLGWILTIGKSGQVGQRNNFSHIIMWGLIASIVLERMGKLSSVKMWGLVLCYSVAMAHSGSRTVLLYIVGLSFMASYLLVMTKEKSSKVFSQNVLIALTIALFAQFAFPLILNNFIPSDISSGADRLIGDSEYLSRWLEWQKAWLAFLRAPLFGHGWGSYGFQSFWLHDQVAITGLSRSNQYFSHSHNLLLQLFAEVGLIGTLILIIPISFILLKAFFKYSSDVVTIGFVMMCVISLLHSMVEFPLWRSNLLIVFSLIFFLIVRKTTCDDNNGSKESTLSIVTPTAKKSIWVKIGIAYAMISLLSISLILIDHDRKLTRSSILGDDMTEMQLSSIGKQGEYIYFYKKYDDLLNIYKTDANLGSVQQIQLLYKRLLDNMQVFPYYTHIMTHIIYLQKIGKQDEAYLWIDKFFLYYPRRAPILIKEIQEHPQSLGGLKKYIAEKCSNALAAKMYGLKPDQCLIPVPDN